MIDTVRYIEDLLSGKDLRFDQAEALMDAVFDGTVVEAQLAAFLAGMRAKGPSGMELAGMAGSLRKHAVPVNSGIDGAVDT